MSGNGGTGLSGDVFVGEDGSIDWKALATTIVGALLTVVGVGFASVWNAVFQGAIMLADGVASFAADVVSSILGTATSWATLAWRIPTGIVRGLTGVWVPVAAIALVLGFLYILGWSDDG